MKREVTKNIFKVVTSQGSEFNGFHAPTSTEFVNDCWKMISFCFSFAKNSRAL